MSPEKSKGPELAKGSQTVQEQTARFRTAFNYDHRLPLVFLVLVLFAISIMVFFAITRERSLQNIPITAGMDIKNLREVFPRTPEGKLWAPLPVTEPGLDTPALLQWVVEASVASFTMNFIDYERVISKASMFYTKIGYQHYRKAIVESGLLNLVQNNKFVTSVKPTSAPIILKEKPTPDGTYSWHVQIPIRVSLANVKDISAMNLTLTMQVIRVPESESPDGVAIGFLYVRKERAI